MNLFERFWRKFEEWRAATDSLNPEWAPISITPVHAPNGVRNEAARDLTSIVRRAAKRFPPVVLSQPAFSERPFCLVYTVSGSELPEFHELFEQYVDKNAFMAEVFLRLRPHCEMPYVLFLGPHSYFLYDVGLEELLHWGNTLISLEELLLQPLDASESVADTWNAIPRKTVLQRSEEFARWIDLWKAAIGSRMNATPVFMQNLMQKIVLLFLYDFYFGFEDPDLHLRTIFLERKPYRGRKKPEAVGAPVPQVDSDEPPFDGVAWLHQASQDVRDRHCVDFLFWTQAESSFFALMGADMRGQFSQFILELFLLSQCKFDAQVQSDAFSGTDSRLKLWKYSVTETLNIRRRLQADDVNVYEPLVIDLEESGVGWALHVVQQTLEFWREKCAFFAEQLAGRRPVRVQFDMFQQPNLEEARIPLPDDVVETAFSTSVRILYSFPVERSTLEFLVVLSVFNLCRKWELPLQPLDHLADIFIRKDRVGNVLEI